MCYHKVKEEEESKAKKRANAMWVRSDLVVQKPVNF